VSRSKVPTLEGAGHRGGLGVVGRGMFALRSVRVFFGRGEVVGRCCESQTRGPAKMRIAVFEDIGVVTRGDAG
jgi:hypothetical protein